jgi:hypothetical protein
MACTLSVDCATLMRCRENLRRIESESVYVRERRRTMSHSLTIECERRVLEQVVRVRRSTIDAFGRTNMSVAKCSGKIAPLNRQINSPQHRRNLAPKKLQCVLTSGIVFYVRTFALLIVAATTYSAAEAAGSTKSQREKLERALAEQNRPAINNAVTSINESLGDRRGVPETPDRYKRVPSETTPLTKTEAMSSIAKAAASPPPQSSACWRFRV